MIAGHSISTRAYLMAAISVFGMMSCAAAPEVTERNIERDLPAERFDLSHWSITLPVDANEDGKVDVINEVDIQSFEHPDYFYIDENGGMVFMSPNKAATTPNSTNTRSELRYESRGGDLSIKSADPKNNFALAAHENASNFASIGGKLEATLKVDHVSRNAGNPDKWPAYSVVVGQIHAGKAKTKKNGFGWGNEPLKIFYKKWPNHEYGSVFWTYERNLAVDDSNRTDIGYPVWGKRRWDSEEPGESGVALGETFSYTVNVVENTMYLTFQSERLGEVKHEIDLSNNVDANGEVDTLDHPSGYSGDYLYFKAGAYNQCSTKDAPTFRYPACPGTGDLGLDTENGNYTQVTFQKLEVSEAE